MDYVLTKAGLPWFVINDISKKVHKLNFTPCLNEIKYNLIWIRNKHNYSFLVGRRNYFHLLEDDTPYYINSKGEKTAFR